MQSQTTFAALGKGEDGEYEVRVLKQKIWVDGISYELQVGLAILASHRTPVVTFNLF